LHGLSSIVFPPLSERIMRRHVLINLRAGSDCPQPVVANFNINRRDARWERACQNWRYLSGELHDIINLRRLLSVTVHV